MTTVYFAPRFLVTLAFLLFLNVLNAQISHSGPTTLVVDKNQQTIHFTAAPGTISQPDTITLDQREHSGRYKFYFFGDGQKYFKVLPPFRQGKSIKLKKYQEVKVAIAFCPPASLTGTIHAHLEIVNPNADSRGHIKLEGKISQ